MSTKHNWPVLDFNEIEDTLATLHQWIQIIGKIRLKTMPWQNHSWHTTLYISTCGYTTQPIPYEEGVFQIDLDIKHQQFVITRTDHAPQSFKLESMTVADFYTKVFDKLAAIGLGDIKIYGKPNEMDPAIPFKENTINKIYDHKASCTLWDAMMKTNQVFQKFRSSFVGKCSPVHLFWGAFDLAITRFSGNAAPLHQGTMANMPQEVMQEAYSKEVSSAGFWPGSKEMPSPSFYAYSYPTAPEFGKQPVAPEAAFYSQEMGEFFLKYEDVIQSDHPEETLLAFLQTTYEAAAKTLNWDRTALEREH